MPTIELPDRTLPVPDFAGFPDLATARIWQRQHGGHLFVVMTDHAMPAGEVIWFSLKFVPTGVLLHPAIAGRWGALNPIQDAVA